MLQLLPGQPERACPERSRRKGFLPSSPPTAVLPHARIRQYRMLVSGECRRRGWTRTGPAFLEVHAFNQPVRDGINVPHFAIRKDIATQAFHELTNFDVGHATFPLDYLHWFHVRIKLLPLTCPIGPNLFFPDNPPAFRCLGPASVLTHERQRAVDIPLVEGRVGLSDQCLCVHHESSLHEMAANALSPGRRG